MSLQKQVIDLKKKRTVNADVDVFFTEKYNYIVIVWHSLVLLFELEKKNKGYRQIGETPSLIMTDCVKYFISNQEPLLRTWQRNCPEVFLFWEILRQSRR